jgi:DNA-binding winged-HTH domains
MDHHELYFVVKGYAPEKIGKQLKMSKKFIINDRVKFIPSENKLVPLGMRGKEVILHTPVNRFLLLLVSGTGRVISQEEIYREVWEKYGQRVTPNTLYQNVSLLRRGLKTAGITTLTIKTHPKSGFSFFGDIQEFEEDDGQPKVETAERQDLPSAEVAQINAAKSETSTPLPHVDSGRRKKKRAAHILNLRPTLRVVLIFLVIAVFLMILTPSSTDEHFTSEQNLVARVNGCPVYVDRGNSKVGLTKIIEYLREHDVSCREHGFLYMTKAPGVNQVIIMRCSSADEDFNCGLLMRLPSYLTPEPRRQR